MTRAALAQRLRLPLGFLLAALYLLFARPRPRTLGIGLVLALGGVLVRAWASGHIAKNQRLAITGPYAHTRNPLYLGSFLIACGFAIAARWWLLAVVVAFFVLIYFPTMRREREKIRSSFPEEYREYERQVPAFLPRLVPWRPAVRARAARFSPSLYMRHGEWKVALGYLGAMAWLLVRAWRLG
ncbi:MAG TPA: isoprenylcysteine carboxylmethyltransferase family protein [Gemmatimonadaceae bacterium]|nr:isoprenylcysteine carboxylmethyltransferase family protein [Gemmatimonadaceae bacterium]